MESIIKYPRTPHLEASRTQPGDEELEHVSFSRIAGRHIVVEEKVDGANAGLRFDTNGLMRLQSRGHYLLGGPRERHFNLFKTWATAHQDALRERLGSEYILYGEWLYAKHTVFYDLLPHYFMDFDLLDVRRREFLSTPRRAALLEGARVCPVRVLYEGPARSSEHLRGLVASSHFKSPAWRERLDRVSHGEKLDPERVRRETDPSDAMEGLYIKVEEAGLVTERYKFVRESFLTSITDAGSHWLSRPIVPNQLAPGVDLFAP